jgi:hypothetical protein
MEVQEEEKAQETEIEIFENPETTPSPRAQRCECLLCRASPHLSTTFDDSCTLLSWVLAFLHGPGSLQGEGCLR